MTTEEIFYDSGPFCPHDNDPSDCEEVCGNCGHKCKDHEHFLVNECTVEGCTCAEWKEPPMTREEVNGEEHVDEQGRKWWMGTLVHPCPACGVAPTNVDDCGHFGDPECPYFGKEKK